MDYKNVKFSASYTHPSQLPKSLHPEISFVGRSNVGKSSLINKIFRRKKLVKVSSKSGCTQAINFFSAENVDFVDLPGYGFAHVSKAEKQRWRELIDGYFEQKRQHALCVLLIDIRHEAKRLDIQMIKFLRDHEIPFAIAFTKCDKLAKGRVNAQMRTLCKHLGAPGMTIVQACSAITGDGVKELRAIIDEYAG